MSLRSDVDIQCQLNSRHVERYTYTHTWKWLNEWRNFEKSKKSIAILAPGLTLTFPCLPIISKSCSTTFFWLDNIKRISKFLARDKSEMVLRAFITGRIDYCNGLLYGLPDCEITKVQRVQNAAARLLTLRRKNYHIIPVLKNSTFNF